MEGMDIMAGTLYLCATPIGNLEDITLRVLSALKEADLIAAEDTRNSIRLLNYFDIKTPMTSYHEHNKIEKAAVLIEKLKAGQNIALITDAGTPGISDPGEELAGMCLDAGITVTALPGASALLTAVSSCGIKAGRFAFEAFLPTDRKKRQTVLSELRDETRAIVIYEAPHHLVSLLSELREVLGESRRMAVCRELTKLHESICRMTIGEAAEKYAKEAPRGEFVLVIEGRSFREIEEEEQDMWSEMDIASHMEHYLKTGIERKEAMRQVAHDRGIPKREVYRALLDKEKRNGYNE